MVTESVPKAKGHVYSIDYFPRSLQNILVDPVLVNGPDGWHMRVEQLGQRDVLVAGPGANQPRLADGRVADEDTFYQLLVWLFVVHPSMPVGGGRVVGFWSVPAGAIPPGSVPFPSF